jgi:localization factor PodJL
MDPKPQAAGGFTQAAPADKQVQAFVPPPVKDPETVGAIASQQAAPSSAPAEPARSQIQLADIPVGALPPALTKAAGVGQPAAIYEVASRYFEGRTLPRDAKSAAKWFERAASQGFAPAQYRLGSMYEKGVGVSVDPTVAKNWYRQAADRGNAKAMHNLGVLIAEGSGGKPDYEAAAIWFRKAADLGVRDSQYNLAILTARGLGVQQSLAQSYTWFALAAAQGDEDAVRKRDEVASRLDATTLATAKAAADAFKPGKLDEAANDIGAPAGGWETEINASAGGKAKPRN